MVYLSSCTLELRGISDRHTKDGKVYYMVNCEDDEGNAIAFYAPNADGFEQGLKKGDSVRVIFELKRYQNTERLVVVKVAKYTEKVEK